MTADYYRFERVFRSEGKSPGYTGSYLIKDLRGAIFSWCDTFGHCLKAPTVFFISPEVRHTQFVMEARGRILNRTYDLRRTRTSPPFAIVQGERIHGWRISNPAGQQILRIVDPDRWKKKLQFWSSGRVPESYIAVRTTFLLATIRSGFPMLSLSVPKSRRLKVLGNKSDWVIAFEPEAADEIDHRLLWAVGVLLNEEARRGI